MATAKVGIREFRGGLAKYIAASSPVAVTRRGQTVGFFIPVRSPSEADLAALKQAGQSLDRLLATMRVTEDELVSDFRRCKKE